MNPNYRTGYDKLKSVFAKWLAELTPACDISWRGLASCSSWAEETPDCTLSFALSDTNGVWQQERKSSWRFLDP